MKPAVTICAIARRVGVSHVSVSNVLNRPGQAWRVSPKTAERIRAAAREMGYAPNHTARSLRTGRTGNILGVFDADLLRSVPKRIRAFETVLRAHGYNLMLQFLDGLTEAEKLARLEKTISLADGLIVFNLVLQDAELQNRCAALLRNGPPCLAPTAPLDGVPCNFTAVNWNKSFGLVGRHLQRLGHRSVGIAGIRADAGHVPAFRRALARIKLESEDLIVDQDWGARAYYQAGVEVARRWLAMNHPPTAIYCAGDELAFSLIETVRAQGVCLPRDLAVIGGGDAEFHEWMRPRLTVLTHSEDDLANMAVSDLMRRIEAGERSPGTGACVGLIRQRLIVGESCGAKLGAGT